MIRTLELHAGEGGDDAKMLVADFSRAYERFFDRKAWKHRVVRQRPAECGYHEICFEIDGDDLSGLDHETGGSRCQRVSPTEKRGRVHTSTVTIAVINPEISLNKLFEQRSDDDFKIEWFSGTGKGGQHRNKHQNSARVIHVPTGLKQERQGRHREANFRDAKQALVEMLDEKLNAEKYGKLSETRKGQLGSGQRGDKTRTIRFQDNIAKNHNNGKSCRADKLMDGFFDLLWS